MSMLTPLKRVRGLGSAKDGTGHFWTQRVTAVANVIVITIFVFLMIRLNGAPYEEVRTTLSNPFVSAVVLLTLLSVLWHARLGIQVVIEDYIHAEPAKLLLLMANTFFVAAVGVASAVAVLKIAFTG